MIMLLGICRLLDAGRGPDHISLLMNRWRRHVGCDRSTEYGKAIFDAGTS